MSTRLSIAWLAAVFMLAAALHAQPVSHWTEPADAILFRVPHETGLELVEQDFSRTEISVRGPAAVIELRCRLTLANRSSRTLRGVALAVRSSGPGMPGGRASVIAASLAAGRGERIPIDVNLRLVRPLPAAGEPLVEIDVDGVLYADLSFRGADMTSARRRMTLLELEAQRDRERFSELLARSGREGLRREVLAVLERQTARPDFEVRLAGGDGRSVSPAVQAAMEPVELAFLELEGAPLELLAGSARAGAGRAVSPSLEVRNRSAKAIRDFEVGWVVQDLEGKRYAAGAIPATGEPLAAGRTANVLQQRLFEFRLGGADSFEIGGMSGYVRRVEFDDGSVWTPSRAALEQAALLDVEPVSNEESRLATVYRSQGLQGLIEELQRF